MDETSEQLDPRFGYFMRVFTEQWVTPRRTPSMLDLSRDASPISLAFARLGFTVTRIRLRDTSLEELGARLESLRGRFDVVCCSDLLEHLDDWNVVLRRIAARLRPGGLFLYSVASGRSRLPRWVRGVARWLRARRGAADPYERSLTAGDVVVALRSARLLPREMVSLAADADSWTGSGTVDPHAGTFAGWALREADRPAAVAPMRWDFQGTGERWLVGRAVAASPLVARLGAQ